MERLAIKSVVGVIVFTILINLSARVFNTYNSWCGILIGIAAIIVTYLFARSIIKSINKPK